ncbi:protein-disulfide reductase DsbD [Aquincola sp. S2]|uniref:Thiol:disulfide interchange protein DsbD n=1 Tax=Pseudaquabacterium terrae TaxID=2732868 RepID=A0ABX2EBD1_9BURK|nr:protein-disulfide reductase DsbD [Aquabacterium terrae]NRF66429.1 protein-disulfide reductase DsbD [Aquabacterium terrae]
MSFRVHRPFQALAALLLIGLLLLTGMARAADDFLEPEKAFRFTARALSATEAELSFQVAPGYYLYRERFAFAADGATLGEPNIPAGKVKYDENFQKNVETLRGELRIVLPLTAAGPYTLRITSQGCADAGLCYPPMISQARLDTAAVTAATSTSPGTTAASSWGDGSMVESALQSGHFWRIVGVFLLVGVLLSLTPCVLPMLPILSSIIVGTQRAPSRGRGLMLAASYSLGMALVYTALGVAAGLAGEGFAAALQTPWAIGAFAALLAVFSLAMFDVYELRLPARFTSRVSHQCNRLKAGQLAGVFMMGGLSALIVSPCVSAPLAGALLFISQSRDLVLGGGALFALAMGMSVPLLVLGGSSGRWMPKSGPWMFGVKRLCGALMLAVAIWIAQPVLPAAAVLALWGVLLVVVGVLLVRPLAAAPGGASRTWPRRGLGAAALALGALQLIAAATGGRDPLQPWAHWTEAGAQSREALRFVRVRSVAELDAALAGAQRPVMLDFYADWCVSCKEMERFTFRNAEVARRLGPALLLKADVTGNTAEDRALLRRFRLFGPPGTLFFDAGGREIGSARVVGFQSAGRFQRSLEQAGL